MSDFKFAGTPDFQSMPNQSTPVLDPDGTMNMAWYRFFLSLQKKSGLAPSIQTGQFNRIGVQNSSARNVSSTLYFGGPNASVGIYSESVEHYLNVYDIQTGQFVGRVQFTDWFGA